MLLACFSRAFRGICSDWFTALSAAFLIGQSNYFGVVFTTLNLKAFALLGFLGPNDKILDTWFF